jgi:hypothetical protein
MRLSSPQQRRGLRSAAIRAQQRMYLQEKHSKL